MKTRKGQVAWLSARSQRVFANFDDAVEDAMEYLKIHDYKSSYAIATNDIYIVHLWLNKK